MNIRIFDEGKKGNGECLFLVSPIPPSVNHYLNVRTIIKNGKPVSIKYCTNEAKKYKSDFSEYVKEEIKKQNYSLKPDKYRHFYIDAIAYFPRMDMDISNYWKVLLDSITDVGLVWVDDNTVCERAQRILYDNKSPRIELYIHPVEYIGIFNNVFHLKEFESRCIECVKYTRNCSILSKAKEGRIQEEIEDYDCKKFKRIKGE